MLNRSYTRFKVSPPAYYSRFFESKHSAQVSSVSSNPKKRKRKSKKQPHSLNEKEQAADQRHQEARSLLLKAHESLLGASDFPAIMRKLNLIVVSTLLWLIVSLIVLKSDLGQIHNIIPAESDSRFNLIMVDCVLDRVEVGFGADSQHYSWYPTLPNRYFLSLPIKQLSHTGGALVALWVTNREKLHNFVEKELFTARGMKGDGSLISDLDLFHHRRYECLLLGYCHGKVMDSEYLSEFRAVTYKHTVISIPRGYSRKPPIGGISLSIEYLTRIVNS
ncbi:hypothetical protein REPUB_Repub19eG0033600 [Reevesia pubescens]